MTTTSPCCLHHLTLVAGDGAEAQAAWEELVTSIGPSLRATCRRVLDDSDQADDAYQETLLRIRRGATGFRGLDERTAQAWLHRIAGNTAREWQRRQRRRHRHEHPLQDDLVQIEDEREQDELEALAGDVRQALRDLAPRHRLILQQHFIDGHGYAELARTHGISVNAARVRVHRALQALRRHLRRSGRLLSLLALAQCLAAEGGGLVSNGSALLPTTGGLSLLTKFGLGLGMCASVGLVSLGLAWMPGQEGIAPPIVGSVSEEVGGDPVPVPETEVPAWVAELERVCQQRLTVNLPELSLEETLDFLRRNTTAAFHCEAWWQDEQPSVTLALKDVRLSSLLDALAEQTGGQWVIDRQEPRILLAAQLPAGRPGPVVAKAVPEHIARRLDQEITVSWMDNSLTEIIDFLRRTTGLNYINYLPQGGEGSFSLDIRNTTVHDLLDTIAKTADCRWIYRHEAICFYPENRQVPPIAAKDPITEAQVKVLLGDCTRLMRLGRSAEAAQSLKTILQQPACSDAVLYEWMLAWGNDFSQQDDVEFEDLLKEVLRRARKHQRILRENPRYIALLIDKLSASERERLAATNELVAIREAAIPQLVQAYTAGPEARRVYLRLVLTRMGHAAITPLIDAYPAQDKLGKGLILTVLGDISDGPLPPQPDAEEDPLLRTLYRAVEKAVAKRQQDRQQQTLYVVQSGDTAMSIAKRFYGSSRQWQQLVAANPQVDWQQLRVGQQISIPKLSGLDRTEVVWPEAQPGSGSTEPAATSAADGF